MNCGVDPFVAMRMGDPTEFAVLTASIERAEKLRADERQDLAGRLSKALAGKK